MVSPWAIDDLTAVVIAHHEHELATADAVAALDGFEKRTGFRLPLDLRAFYTRVRSAVIGDRYRLLRIDELLRTAAALQGEEWEDSEPASWYAFCDVFDGNFVGIDLEPDGGGAHRILDCDHESLESRHVIASSFTEFLARALASGDRLFYLGSGPYPIVEVPYRPPSSWLQREYHRWSIDPEVGPERCAKNGCNKLHVALSVLCRRHHFEAIHRSPYPFAD